MPKFILVYLPVCSWSLEMGNSGLSPTVDQTEVARGRTGRRVVSMMQLNITGTILKATRVASHIHAVKLFHPPEQGG